jgi:uncharacterized membrane protein HdeD (DUF308 family)
LRELAACFPAALVAGAAMQMAARFDFQHASPPATIAGGALLGFLAAPCGLGIVAVAGALHAHAPIAATAFLCVAGICDVRALRGAHTHAAETHDAFAYGLLAAALGIVAWRHGDALVHPAIGVALAFCAAAALILAVIHRARQCPRVRWAPGLMLLGALVTAPAPSYHATETTLSDLFPGERLTFTGTVTRDKDSVALVRYAITCCRADAAPVVVRLARTASLPADGWARVYGTVENDAGDMRLVPQRIERIAPPGDPFIYR